MDATQYEEKVRDLLADPESEEGPDTGNEEEGTEGDTRVGKERTDTQRPRNEAQTLGQQTTQAVWATKGTQTWSPSTPHRVMHWLPHVPPG